MLLNWLLHGVDLLFHVQWGNYIADGFAVSNGVRQGDILSPFLFSFYMDALCHALNGTGV